MNSDQLDQLREDGLIKFSTDQETLPIPVCSDNTYRSVLLSVHNKFQFVLLDLSNNEYLSGAVDAIKILASPRDLASSLILPTVYITIC